MTNKEILIFGAGFIGKRIRDEFDCQISSQRIATLSDALSEIVRYSPKVIINCIGATGKTNVDDCEHELDKTLFANSFIPGILAEAAFRNRIKLVHISTGCIYHYDYQKDSPLAEDREPDFFDLYYSRTKIYAENALAALSARQGILIPRLRIPLDNRPHPRNILDKLIRFKKVIDLPNSVTYIPDFIAALEHLIKIDATGIYNVVNKGGLVYPELLEVYKKYVPSFAYGRIDFAQLHIVRTNLLLSTEKLEKSGFKVRDIRDILQECVGEYVRGKS